MSDRCSLDVTQQNATSNHVFLIPGLGTVKRASLRKRKRRDSDCSSVNNLDLSLNETVKKSKLSRVSSLVSLISPAKSMQKLGNSLQKSLSGVHISSPKAVLRPRYDENSVESPRLNIDRRKLRSSFSIATPNRLWIETIGHEAGQKMSQKMNKREMHRQEAIFELYQGEITMVEDLQLVTKIYRDSLLHLGILTKNELKQIFGTLHILLPLHKDLCFLLKNLQDDNLFIEAVGKVLLEWAPKLVNYIDYCSNLLEAKELLDAKKCEDRRLQEFLQRCLESPFSRKLDLWSFIDVPRNRLVKYPLLFRNILKLTSEDHEDIKYMSSAISQVEDIIKDVDRISGYKQCQFYRLKLYHINEDQLIPEINSAKSLICSGVLRNNRGTKLNTFLFDSTLVMSRSVMNRKRHPGISYQIYRQPFPVSQLLVEVLNDGEVKFGSFKSTFQPNHASRHLFRIIHKNCSQVESQILQARSDHDKKQWINSFQKLSIGIIYSKENLKIGLGDKVCNQIKSRYSVPVMKISENTRPLSSITNFGVSDPNAVIMSSKSVYI